MSPARNVLIFHQAALGDFVLNWPLAVAAGRLFPQSRIFYVTSGMKGQLAQRVLRTEFIDLETGWHALHGDAAALPETARQRLAASHCIFSFVNRAGDVWEQNVRSLAPQAQVHCLNPTPPTDYPHHTTQFLLDQLVAYPALHTAVAQILESIRRRGILPTAGSGGHAGPIQLHPGSGGASKCWPIQNFAALAQRLLDAGRSVQVLLGEVERERLSSAELNLLPGEVQTKSLETPLELFDALAGGQCLIANDSGPAHLAGILGGRIVSLFGPTNPAVWRPLGPRVQVLHHTPLATLDVETVFQACQQFCDSDF